MRILLTAFEPFDGTGLNSSLEACRALLRAPGGLSPEWDLRFLLLPVEYGADTAATDAELSARPCDLVLHTGQAAAAKEVRVERVAVNVRYPDARLRLGAHVPILPEGPAALFATVPVIPLVEAICGAGVPAAPSNYAGAYLCNHVLFCSLLRAGPDGPRVGFLHLPPLPEQAPDSPGALPADRLARAVGAALACLVRRSERDAFAL